MMKRSISKTTAKIAGAAADFGDNSEPGGYRILQAGIFRVHLFAVAQGKGLTHHSQLDNSDEVTGPISVSRASPLKSDLTIPARSLAPAKENLAKIEICKTARCKRLDGMSPNMAPKR